MKSLKLESPFVLGTPSPGTPSRDLILHVTLSHAIGFSMTFSPTPEPQALMMIHNTLLLKNNNNISL
jgi:hypothetical protein